MSKAKSQSVDDGKEYLRSSFLAEQEILKGQLKLSATSITHNGVMGDVNEQHFIDFLKRHLPKRYAVDSAIVIDSNGNTSDQIDIVIFDNQYTPTLLSQHDHRFVPAEAVYSVIEVKPVIDKENLVYAGGKAESVRKLARTSSPVYHLGGTSAPKELLDIPAGIVAYDIDWADGLNSKAFSENLLNLTGQYQIDFGLGLSGGVFDNFSGSHTLGAVDNSLAYFLFRLLGKLQVMGTVPAVDWNKYANVMSKSADNN